MIPPTEMPNETMLMARGLLALTEGKALRYCP